MLRLLSSGSFQNVIADDHLFQMSQATVSVNMKRVVNALKRQVPNYITFPSTDEERANVRRAFYEKFGFPSIAGVIDGTHILIEKPFVDDWFSYLNRKSKFSLNVQIVSYFNFYYIDSLYENK